MGSPDKLIPPATAPAPAPAPTNNYPDAINSQLKPPPPPFAQKPPTTPTNTGNLFGNQQN